MGKKAPHMGSWEIASEQVAFEFLLEGILAVKQQDSGGMETIPLHVFQLWLRRWSISLGRQFYENFGPSFFLPAVVHICMELKACR
jgi:hypothetical protein